MADHLEPYRRMARSIRFVPPIWESHRFYRHLTEPAAPPPVVLSPVQQASIASSPVPESLVDMGPPIDPSAHAEALIREAVSRPTHLPIAYCIQESIGDRISKLADQRSRSPIVMPPPKIPEPDPNWMPVAVEVPIAEDRQVVVRDCHHQDHDTETVHPKSPSVAAEQIPMPTPIDATESENGVSESHAADPVSNWFGSVSNYLESVAQTIESVTHKPTEPETSPLSNGLSIDLESCPKCHSADVRKNGRRSGQQKYLCNNCRRQFTANQTTNQPESTPVKPAARRNAKGFGTKQ